MTLSSPESDELSEFRLCVVVVIVLGSVPHVLDLVFVGGAGAPHGYMTVEVHPQE